MRTIFARWDVTETHAAEIDVPDDVEDIDEWLDSDVLAQHEDNTSYEATPDRSLVEWEEC